MSLRKRFLVGLTGLAALVMGAGIGCGSNNSGCKTDMDCREPRVCDYDTGQCVDPDDNSISSDKVFQVSAGGNHTCALLKNGAVKCWGYNDNGELGDGTTTQRLTPVFVSGLTNAVKIGIGYGHTCALIEDGTVKCWGSNYQGQLGDGTTTRRLTPVFVSELTDVIQIEPGANHTCALMENRTVKCWGYNGNGELGDGTNTQRLTPTPSLDLMGVAQIGLGWENTCALMDDGNVRCWGSNDYGQLGNGTSDYASHPEPASVSGLTNAVKIGLGDSHACALIENGTVKCWGGNHRGQLGNGTSDYASHPEPASVSGLTNAVKIGLGDSHACALIENGTVKCWGSNNYGQLGNGTCSNSDDSSCTGEDHYSPIIVSGLASVQKITGGWGFHSCVLIGNGIVKCWGWNNSGQLGDGTTEDHYIPTLISQ